MFGVVLNVTQRKKAVCQALIKQTVMQCYTRENINFGTNYDVGAFRCTTCKILGNCEVRF